MMWHLGVCRVLLLLVDPLPPSPDTRPTIVSGLEIYEVNNPGSIIEIRGRLANKAPEQQPDEEWLTLWTGPPQPSVPPLINPLPSPDSPPMPSLQLAPRLILHLHPPPLSNSPLPPSSAAPSRQPRRVHPPGLPRCMSPPSTSVFPLKPSPCHNSDSVYPRVMAIPVCLRFSSPPPPNRVIKVIKGTQGRQSALAHG